MDASAQSACVIVSGMTAHSWTRSANTSSLTGERLGMGHNRVCGAAKELAAVNGTLANAAIVPAVEAALTLFTAFDSNSDDCASKLVERAIAKLRNWLASSLLTTPATIAAVSGSTGMPNAGAIEPAIAPAVTPTPVASLISML